MDPQTLTQLSRLLDGMLEVPPDERTRWIESLEGRHEALKPRLREMLTRMAAVETSDFLATLPKLEAHPEPQVGTGRSGEIVGPYRLERQLGAGGMGAVWLAERADGLMHRRVALKLPHLFTPRRAELAARMAREREILATLDHPNIARLLDAGITPDGQPFLALEFVEGEPIDRYVRDSKLPLAQCLRLFLQVAHAVAYAHGKLIIHRDLKPANILVTAAGQVRLLDFGIAKLLDEGHAKETRLTELSGRALTLDYASPEQIAGEPLTVASDIYSLGVMLYELLTGSRPYRPKRDSRGALEDEILLADPPWPSAVGLVRERRALRGDLDTIALKALKKEPQDRYATANALADDIARHLDGRPVLARPDDAWYRTRKFVGRHRLAVSAAGVVLLAVIGGAALALWQARVATEQRNRAESVREFIASIFQNVDPNLSGGSQSLSAIALLERAETRIGRELADRPDIRHELREVIARSYMGLFDWPHAIKVLQIALADDAAGDMDRGRRLRLQYLLAESQKNVADFEAAARTLAPVLAAGSAGALDATTYSEAQLVLTSLELQRSDFEAAQRAALVLIEFAETHAGVQPATVAQAWSIRSQAADMLRDSAHGFEYSKRAYEEMKARGDLASPVGVDIQFSLGVAYVGTGRPDIALDFIRNALTGARRLYGERSLVAGRYTARLGQVLFLRGELDSAIESLATAEAIGREAGQAPTTTHAGQLRTLGRALVAARRFPEAIPHFNQAMTYLQAPNNARILRVLRADEAFVRGFSSPDAAVADLRRVIAEQDANDTGGRTFLPDYYLGVIALWNDDAGGAVEHLSRAAELVRTQSALPAERGDVLIQLGLARLARDEIAAAEALLNESRDLLAREQTAMTPAAAENLIGLARLALNARRPEVALPLLERADRYWREHAAAHRWAGESAYWLARGYAALGRHDEARVAYASAESLLRASTLPLDRRLVRLARESR